MDDRPSEKPLFGYIILSLLCLVLIFALIVTIINQNRDTKLMEHHLTTQKQVDELTAYLKEMHMISGDVIETRLKHLEESINDIKKIEKKNVENTEEQK